MQEKNWFAVFALWGLAGYCGYQLYINLPNSLGNFKLSQWSVMFWVRLSFYLAGIYIYPMVALGKKDNREKWFHIFSGIFAGICTYHIWWRLFPALPITFSAGGSPNWAKIWNRQG